MHALKDGGKGLLLKAVNQDGARGQAVAFLKSAAGGSVSKVALIAGNLDFRIHTNYDNMAVNDDNVGNSALFIDANRNVGICTTTPNAARLQVNVGFSSYAFQGLSGAPGNYLGFGLGRAANEFTIGIAALDNNFALNAKPGDVILRTEDATKSLLIANGSGSAAVTINNSNVIIGAPDPSLGSVPNNYKLNVWGRARANELVVNTDGADFVFAKDYRLRPLREVEQFIATKQHLPEIPSAKEMQENGMAVGELQTKLLQKVEELTLYVIEQNKKLEAQNKKIELLEQALAQPKK